MYVQGIAKLLDETTVGTPMLEMYLGTKMISYMSAKKIQK